MEIRPTIKELREKSKLVDICQGDVVNILGISSLEQNEMGRVIIADKPTSIGDCLRLVAVRISLNEIELRAYFTTPYGIKQRLKVEKYKEDSQKYIILNRQLQEVEL